MSVHTIRPIPVVRAPAKGRLLAMLDEMKRTIAALPEPACVVLEEAKILASLRAQLEAVGSASAIAGVFGEAWAAVARAVQVVQTARRPTRR